MRGRKRYQVVAGITALSILVGACSCGSERTPTPFPYKAPPPGTVSPIVVQRTPEAGEELPLDGAIQLVFDRAMDKASVESAFHVYPAVSGGFQWSDERTVSFEPSSSLERDARYDVTLGPEAKAQDGSVIDGVYRFRVQTVGYLQVTQVVPAPGSNDVEADSRITVIFNRPIVPLTAVSDPAYGSLPQPLSIDPPAQGAGEWLNTSIYAFTPDEDLAGGTRYSVVVERGLEDTTGGVLDQDYSWSFNTQPPQVVWVSPPEGDDLVDVDSSVEVEFNMNVDPESAAGAFVLRAGAQEVGGQIVIDADTLVFTPTERLTFDTTYTARIAAGVRSAGGGEGMKGVYQWDFTTVPLPRIIGTDPVDGDQSAPPYTSFQIQFNAPIDPTTVMANLEMTPPLSPTQVYTYYSVWNQTFGLNFGVQPSTDYEVRIGPEIADPYGNTTGQEMTVRFRTAPLDPWIQLRASGYLGTYDASEPANIVVAHLNVPQIDFSLYTLGIDDVLEAYEDWYEYEPSVAPIREWSRPVESVLDETGYVAIELAEGGGTLEPGFYLLVAGAPGLRHDRWSQRLMLSVSKYNLTLKTSADELWAWATELATGEPVSGLKLTLWSGQEGKGDSATTDSDGLASLDVFPSGSRYGVFVGSEDPFVFAGTGWEWEEGISPWEFGLEMEPQGQGLNYRGYIYTDRPIYRQGQTVYFRGILRTLEDEGYSLPSGAAIAVSVYDAAGEEILSRSLALDEYGTFNGELELDEGAALGRYTINARLGDDYGFVGEFSVAAYRPPEFEVVVTPSQSELASGAGMNAQVDVSYYFGGPVVDAAVVWNVLSSPYTFQPVQFGRYSFRDEDDPWICRWCWWWEPVQPEVVLSGSGRTDSDGGLGIVVPGTVMTGGQQLTIEATVYGSDGQVISGRDGVVVHKGDFYVGLAAQNYVGRAGEEQAVDVVTVDWSGERLPNQALEMEVYRREWINTFVEGEFGGGAWEWETVDTLVDSGTLSTDSNAEGVAAFTPEDGGSYRLAVSGRDSAGRLVRTSLWLWVGSDDYVSWRRENNDRITLISDKTTYSPGDTAEILIPTPFEGEQWAWITVERAGILQQEVVQMEGNSLVYQLPISADHAPNVYVSAVVVKGADATEPVATHRIGYVLLMVEHRQQEIDVTLTPSSEQAGPGDTVSFDLWAADYSGAPVQGSFSVDLVDKAVLSLSPRTEDEIVEVFYARRGLGVSTSSGLVISINRLLLEQMEDIVQWADGVGGGGGAMEGADHEAAPTALPLAPDRAYAEDEKAGGIELRERFEDTAFWDASVTTGPDGRATVEVELPDNLTTWVCRAVGVTLDTKVGEGLAELVATKPLIVRPVTPRFFVVDDRVQLAALVSNNTGEAQEVEVELQVSGLSLQDDAVQTISIANGAEGRVTWWVTAQDVEAAEVVMSAAAGQFSDASRPRLTTGPEGTLVVHRYSAPEIVGTGGQLTDEDTRTEVVALPPKYDDREGELSVRLDPSLAAGMVDGLAYLEHFPYECTEQVVSRFLPNVLTYRAMQELGLSDPELEAKLPDLVEEGLDRLYLRQHQDGGWGWWYEGEQYGESNPHLTAYVVLALIKAEQTGFAVRNSVLRSGLAYLERQLVSGSELRSYVEGNLQAFILFVLTEGGQLDEAESYAGSLYRRRDRLSHYGRAFLALALGLMDEDDSRIDTLLSDLQNAAILSATGAHWEEEDYDYWGMNTDTRSTAVILEALARLDPENALIQNVVRWLMIARQDGIWETTQETAWALIALTDWMAVTGELQGEYDYAVWLNEELQVQQSVTPETVDESVQLGIGLEELLADQGNRLTVARGPGEGVLYYTAHLNVYLPVEAIEPLNRGVIVSRRYSDPECTDGARCPEVNQASVGDIVQVHLTIIAPHDLYYVVVDDPLPAGGEGIDTSLATSSMLDQEPGLSREVEEPYPWFYYWWWQWYSRSEMRDDRVVLFADYLPAGTYEYSYTFRVTQVGEYRVIPTTAHEFYFPEVFGRADGRLFTVVE
jgi:uncharacterized protein YfaS (alpha-2-macroglobulin family)